MFLQINSNFNTVEPFYHFQSLWHVVIRKRVKWLNFVFVNESAYEDSSNYIDEPKGFHIIQVIGEDHKDWKLWELINTTPARLVQLKIF